MNNKKSSYQTKITLTRIKYGNMIMYFKKPLIADIIVEHYDEEEIFNISLPDLNIYVEALNINKLIRNLSCDLYITWTMYALEKDSKLSNDAKELKYRLRNMFDSWTIGNKNYKVYPPDELLINIPHNFNYNIKLTQNFFEWKVN